MLEKLITTLEVCEYLLLLRHEDLKRLQCRMGTLHILRDSTIVDTNNITVAASTLHPHLKSTKPFHASQSIKKTTKEFDVSCNMHQTLRFQKSSFISSKV
jgi:hypothetical protein